MMDDFFTRAIIAGVGVALVAGPLGCYIVWRRLAYLGDTLSHAGLLGIALALLFQINITLSIFLVSVFVSLALIFLQRRVTLNKPNGIFKVLNSSLDYANFKGEDLIDATLHNGPIKDFNIMTLRSICTSSVTAIDETSESLLNINADKLLVYSIKPVNIQIGLEVSIGLEANHLLQFNYYINNTMILDKTQAIVIQINYKK